MSNMEELKSLLAKTSNELACAKHELETHKSGHMTMVRVCEQWEHIHSELIYYMYCREKGIEATPRSEFQVTEDFAQWVYDFGDEIPSHLSIEALSAPYAEQPFRSLPAALYEDAMSLKDQVAN